MYEKMDARHKKMNAKMDASDERMNETMEIDKQKK